jgi:predicted dehydrogenase
VDRALPALCGLPCARLQAVASRDVARASALAERFGASKAYGDYDALLADPEVDAVYVALPNALHTHWVLAALDQGKAVLCEKPLAYRAADAEQVMRRSEATGLLAADGFMYRFHPQTERLFGLVADGAVGTPCLARGALSSCCPRFRRQAQSWRGARGSRLLMTTPLQFSLRHPRSHRSQAPPWDRCHEVSAAVLEPGVGLAHRPASVAH